jgi:hypothetical protein
MVSFGPGGPEGVAVTVAMVAVATVAVERGGEGVEEGGVEAALFVQMDTLF